MSEGNSGINKKIYWLNYYTSMVVTRMVVMTTSMVWLSRQQVGLAQGWLS